MPEKNQMKHGKETGIRWGIMEIKVIQKPEEQGILGDIYFT